MAKLEWGVSGSRFYEMGVSNGVLYVGANPGVAWSGITAVNEEPSGASPKPFYFNGLKYLNLASAEEFEATIEALSAPIEFGVCDGRSEIHTGLFATQQPRVPFGFSYRTRIGNDTDGLEHGSLIHLVYNALAEPADRSYNTLSDTVEVESRSWKISTLPPIVTGIRPTAHFVVDTRTTDPSVLEELTDLLYGTELTQPELPTAAELIAMFAS